MIDTMAEVSRQDIRINDSECATLNEHIMRGFLKEGISTSAISPRLKVQLMRRDSQIINVYCDYCDMSDGANCNLRGEQCQYFRFNQ